MISDQQSMTNVIHRGLVLWNNGQSNLAKCDIARLTTSYANEILSLSPITVTR